MLTYAIIGGVLFLGLVTLGLVFSKLYKKTTKEMAFVRTGFGGEKVILNGGAVILPVLHDVVFINMTTIRLQVTREKDQALITKDKLRVDLTADFHINVKPEKEAISRAAQTLGTKTLHPEELKTLIEGKLVDALRSVTASMTMEDLHNKRAEVGQQVQNTVSEDLLKNGLALESVSLPNLDQTEISYFNEDNLFDAEGLTVLTKSIESKRKIRNDIKRNTDVEIQIKDLEAKEESLELDRKKAEAEVAQKAEIAKITAQRESEIASEESLRAREAAEAKIRAQKLIEEAEIQKAKEIETARIEKEKQLKVKNQEADIAISLKSMEESEAKAKANEAAAKEVESLEKIESAKAMEEANREKELAIIKAEQEAEEQAIGKKVAAQAEKEAAQDKAEALKISTEAEAEAIKTKAEADAISYEVEAKGKEAINAAENVISQEVLAMRVKTTLIENMPKIVEQIVAPMQNIDSIKIVDMGGRGTGSTVSESNGSMSDNLVNSALKYKTHAPIVESLANEIGLDLSSVKGFTKPLEDIVTDTSTEKVDKEQKEDSKITDFVDINLEH